jgi:demethylmenaquinone methyltransferase/2-methoxy-6-polyprenyl-1,4-benzoquinol methylase
MLQRGRDRLIDEGIASTLCVQGNAECLPLGDATIDCLSIAFGLRNVTHKECALSEMHRVLKPNGRLLVLEFSKPRNTLFRTGFGVYSSLWPVIGRFVTGDSDAYRYLVESIATHPDQETLTMMLEDAGFTGTRVFDFLGGVVALHVAIKS